MAGPSGFLTLIQSRDGPVSTITHIDGASATSFDGWS